MWAVQRVRRVHTETQTIYIDILVHLCSHVHSDHHSAALPVGRGLATRSLSPCVFARCGVLL